jgi:hypothetical protein
MSQARCQLLEASDADSSPASLAYPLFTMSTKPPRPRIHAADRGGKRSLLHGTDGGGARRDRTDDLKLAKLALSQLSYGPEPTASYSPKARPGNLPR